MTCITLIQKISIETTREAVAQEHDRHEANRNYSPLITVIGDGRLIKGFESHLDEAKVDTDYEFDIPPERCLRRT